MSRVGPRKTISKSSCGARLGIAQRHGFCFVLKLRRSRSPPTEYLDSLPTHNDDRPLLTCGVCAALPPSCRKRQVLDLLITTNSVGAFMADPYQNRKRKSLRLPLCRFCGAGQGSLDERPGWFLAEIENASHDSGPILQRHRSYLYPYSFCTDCT